MLNKHKDVVANFVRDEVKITTNLVMLDNHPVTFSNNGTTLDIIADPANTELATKIASIQSGSYITGTYGFGYLNKVSSIEQTTPLQWTMTVTDAALEEVIQEGTAILDRNLTHADLSTNAKSAGSHPLYYDFDLGHPDLKIRRDAPDSDVFEIGLVHKAQSAVQATMECAEITPTTQEKEGFDFAIKGECKGFNDALEFETLIKVKLTVDFAMDFSWFKVESAKITSQVTMVSDIKFKLLLNLVNEKDMVKVLSKHFPPIIFSVGALPVVVVPQFSLSVGTEFKAGARIEELGGQLEQNITAGVLYDKKASPAVKLIGNYDQNHKFHEPASWVNIEAKASVFAKLSLMLYGAIGPALQLEPYIRAEANLAHRANKCTKPTVAAYAGIEVLFLLDTAASNSKKLQFLHDHLSLRKRLHKGEHALHKKFLDGCEQAIMKVSGDASIYGVVKNSTPITRQYTVQNIGGKTLNWKIKYLDTNDRYDEREGTLSPAVKVLGLTDADMTLKPNETADFSITLDPRGVPFGEFNQDINLVDVTRDLYSFADFQNNQARAEAQVCQADDKIVSRDINVTITPEQIPSPLNITATNERSRAVYVQWDAPTSANSQLIERYVITARNDDAPPDQFGSPRFEGVKSVDALPGKTRYRVPVIMPDCNANYTFRVRAASGFTASVERNQAKVTTQCLKVGLRRKTIGGGPSGQSLPDDLKTKPVSVAQASAQAKVDITQGVVEVTVDEPVTLEAFANQRLKDAEIQLPGETQWRPMVSTATGTHANVSPTWTYNTTFTQTGDHTVTVRTGLVSLDAVLNYLQYGTQYQQTYTVRVKEPAVKKLPSKLNDTGITQCGDYAYDASGTSISGHSDSNSENCSASSDAEGDPIPAGQDGHYATGIHGSHGMSFTKLDANGNPLPDSATAWSCVKDDHTGLIWEVKQGGDGTIGNQGLHDADDTYHWYNPDNSNNGGSAGSENSNGNTCHGYVSGTSTTYCNTHAFVNRVNQQGLCGASDWRMPSREELRSIVDYSRVNPAINVDYFPVTRASRYWSSSPNANSANYAWGVHFNYGYGYYIHKSSSFHVRVVRSGQ